MSRQRFQDLERKGLRPDLHRGHADAAAAVHRPGRRRRPRLRGQGAADEGGRRRRARRRAHAEQRRSARRGGADLHGELPVRLLGHGGRRIPTGAGNFFALHDRRRQPASTSSPITAHRDAADDVHEAGEARTGDRRQHGRSAAAHGRPVAGARRLELDRLAWGAVRDAARAFVNSFDKNGDRVALITYSNGARVLDQMPSSRGFNKTKVMADIPTTLPGGSTAMVEGLYRGWDEVRAVPRGQQSGLRVIVLFTDGASNSVPGIYPGSHRRREACARWDFPDNGAGPRQPDPRQSADQRALRHRDRHRQRRRAGHGLPTGTAAASKTLAQILANCVQPDAQYLPATQPPHALRSSGIPTSFPLQTNALKVNGVRSRAAAGSRT